MDRRDFVKLCGVLGLGLPLASCGSGSGSGGAAQEGGGGGGEPDGSETGSVIVVGAGAAGLSAAHLLVQRGVDVRILEAAPVHGGRLKDALDFVDFPIPLGAEWLHDEADTLAEIVDANDGMEVTTELVGYDPDDPAGYFDGELTIEPIGDYTDLKFVGSSWLDFFNRHLLPGLTGRITLDTPVTRIDHSGDRVVVTDASGTDHEADAVIVTVPPTILRNGDIEFVPPLPDAKREALERADIWAGIKVFLEMSERFYPTFVEFPDSFTPAGQRVYYDAGYGQRTDTNVIGLFAVGAQAEAYQALDDDALLARILGELDEVFDGAASRAYVAHVVQNWNDEPFIRQAYLADEADWEDVRTLGEPLGDRVFFAGDTYSDGEDWSSVHVAARSARTAADLVTAVVGAG